MAISAKTLVPELDPVLSVAFNSTFLLDGLNAVGGNATQFNFTEPIKPAVLPGDGSSEDGCATSSCPSASPADQHHTRARSRSVGPGHSHA